MFTYGANSGLLYFSFISSIYIEVVIVESRGSNERFPDSKMQAMNYNFVCHTHQRDNNTRAKYYEIVGKKYDRLKGWKNGYVACIVEVLTFSR